VPRCAVQRHHPETKSGTPAPFYSPTKRCRAQAAEDRLVAHAGTACAPALRNRRFAPEYVRLLQSVIYTFLCAAFTVATAWALGTMLLRKLAIALYALEKQLLAFIAGSVCLSAIVFALCAVGLARKGVFLALGLLAINPPATSPLSNETPSSYNIQRLEKMFRKALLYGLPVYLYGLELLLKSMASVQADSVAGPTLAGAGIGFLLPLTQLKTVKIDDQLQQQLIAAKASAYSPRDKSFSEFIWFAFFVCLLGWMYSIFLTLKPAANPLPPTVNGPLSIGCIIFVISIALSEFKERV
jgi:hypothetical protein